MHTVLKIYDGKFKKKTLLYYVVINITVHDTQYQRGQRTQQEQWVFGMVDTSYQPALGYMEVVQQRDAATLLPIIQAHTAPGTIIHSDEWAAYRQVSGLPTVASHNTVNHSLNLVDPGTGTHTQNVESYWNRVKQKIKRIINQIHHRRVGRL